MVCVHVGVRDVARCLLYKYVVMCTMHNTSDIFLFWVKYLLNDLMNPSLMCLNLRFSVRSKLTQITFVRFYVEMDRVLMFFQIII